MLKTEFDPGRSFYSTKVNLVSYLPIFLQRKADFADFLVESTSLHKLTQKESYTQKLRTSVQMHGNLTSSDLQSTDSSLKALEEGESSKYPVGTWT